MDFVFDKMYVDDFLIICVQISFTNLYLIKFVKYDTNKSNMNLKSTEKKQKLKILKF
jgi:hypothetical protein